MIEMNPHAPLRFRALRSSLATLLFVPLAVFAQENDFHCGANELGRMASLINGDPAKLLSIEQAKAELDHFTATWQGDASRDGDPYVIPVVFHIIHNNGPENISDDQVHDAIRVMNEDYNKTNSEWPNVQPEFLGLVADMGITFKLAQLDPDGNCTNGITRTVSTLTYEGNQAMKNLTDWPRNRYLNIWVSAGAGGAAGYAMYPSSVSSSWGAAADGIVILSDYVGSIGTSSVLHSHSLSHEVGHWLNLMHPWGNSNDPGLATNCGIDDGVGDTPNTTGWTSCNLRGASCGSALDNVENFMEYSYCSKMFTLGQKARLLAALNSSVASRNNLWSASNLELTGLSGSPELCWANLQADKQIICAGSTVSFSDASYNGVTTWNWNFEGGSPGMASSENPEVTYNTPGIYDVSLTVGNGTQSLSVQKSQYVVVLANTGVSLPFEEGFEASGVPSEDWSVNDFNQDGSFEVSSEAAYSGTHSLRLANSLGKVGYMDEMVSNTIDLSNSGPTTISFRYAFAKRPSSVNDVLRLYISKDCGNSWSLKRALTGTSLTTAPPQGGSFTPSGPDQWGYAETSAITGDFLASNLRLKFWFKSDGGNNLWIDDININGTPTGINGPASTSGQQVMVVPNPAGDRAEVVADLTAGGTVQVEVLDVLGRPVMSIANGPRPAGISKWAMDLSQLPDGIYLVRLQQEHGVQVVRFTRK